MDISLEMLGHARALLGENLNAALWNIDAERVPLPDNCIDLCLALMTFNVFPNPHRAATEIHRVLKKDGVVFGTAFIQPPRDEIFNERPIEPDLVREILSVFDPALWELSFENQGGNPLLFTYRKTSRCDRWGRDGQPRSPFHAARLPRNGHLPQPSRRIRVDSFRQRKAQRKELFRAEPPGSGKATGVSGGERERRRSHLEQLV